MEMTIVPGDKALNNATVKKGNIRISFTKEWTTSGPIGFEFPALELNKETLNTISKGLRAAGEGPINSIKIMVHDECCFFEYGSDDKPSSEGLIYNLRLALYYASQTARNSGLMSITKMLDNAIDRVYQST